MKPGADLLTCCTNTCRHVYNLLLLKLNSRILLVNMQAKHEQPTSRHTGLFTLFIFVWHSGNFPQAAGIESFCANPLSRLEPSKCISQLVECVLWACSLLLNCSWDEKSTHISGPISVALYTYQVSFQFHASLSRKFECLNLEIIYVGLEFHLYIYSMCKCNWRGIQLIDR